MFLSISRRDLRVEVALSEAAQRLFDDATKAVVTGQFAVLIERVMAIVKAAGMGVQRELHALYCWRADGDGVSPHMYIAIHGDSVQVLPWALLNEDRRSVHVAYGPGLTSEYAVSLETEIAEIRRNIFGESGAPEGRDYPLAEGLVVFPKTQSFTGPPLTYTESEARTMWAEYVAKVKKVLPNLT